MSDEETTVTEETQEEAPVEPTPDPKAEALEKKEADLKKWEARLQRESSELGRAKKETPKPEGEDYDISDDQLKMLGAMMKKMGVDPDDLSFVSRQFKAQVSDELEDVTANFFKSNGDVSQDEVAQAILDLGVNVENLTPAKAKKVLESAAKNIRADKQAVTIKELQEKVAALTPKEGEQVVEVRAKKGSPSEGHKSVEDALNDPNLSFMQQMAILNAASE